MPLALSDAELAVVMQLAEPIPVKKRDAYLKSVALVLCQCTTRSPGLVHRLALEEQRRFLRPPSRFQVPRRSVRYNGGGHV
jgi:hypothetical protein